MATNKKHPGWKVGRLSKMQGFKPEDPVFEPGVPEEYLYVWTKRNYWLRPNETDNKSVVLASEGE